MAKWKGIVAKKFSIKDFTTYVATLTWGDWEPEFIVLHNTGGLTIPGGLSLGYIIGMEREYRDQKGWSAGPHLFVDSSGIWVFTPLTTPGVHANSWNGTSLGVEMEGDYNREAFESGRGLQVHRNAVAAVSILSAALGIDPSTMRFHRENPGTTHRCPGDNVDKAEFIEAVLEYLEGISEEPQQPPADAAPPMNVSAIGLEFIKKEEGCVLRVYRDQAGFDTIGVGHLITESEKFTRVLDTGRESIYYSKGMTMAQALDLLQKDLSRFVLAVNLGVRVPLSQNQFDALVSFSFNVGTGAFAGSTLLKLLNQGEYDEVPMQLRRWHKAGGKDGVLTARREREIKLWLKEDEDGATAPIPETCDGGAGIVQTLGGAAGDAVGSADPGSRHDGPDLPPAIPSGSDSQSSGGDSGSPSAGAGFGLLAKVLRGLTQIFGGKQS